MTTALAPAVRPRPRNSLCPEGQDFVMGRRGKLVPVHTKTLGPACRCFACRGVRVRAQWTPEKRAARSAAYRAKVAAGVDFGGHRGVRRAKADVWTPQQEAALTALLGRGDTAWIAERLSERFSVPRTTTAIRQRIKRLGLSRLAVRPLSKVEAARALGVSEELLSRWVRSGLLVGIPWRLGGGQRKAHVSQAFTREHVEAFLRSHPDRVHPERIRDRGFRALVDGLTRGRRALTRQEAARLAGVSTSMLAYWIAQGRVPNAYQIDGHFWRIPATDIPLLRSLAVPRSESAG